MKNDSRQPAISDPPRTVWQRVFGLDARSLAVFRMALGVLLLIDLAMRWQTREAFYSEQGVLPLSLQGDLMDAISDRPGALSWSVHALSDSPAWLYTLFAASLVSYLAFIAGFRTRIASVVAWVLLASWHVRNPLIMHSGDTLLRLAMFWSMFLPLGSVWSLDARQATAQGQQPASRLVTSPATAGLIMLLFSLYLFAGIAKLTPRWFDGTAMEYVLRLDIYATSFGKSMLDHPEILKVLTWSTVVLELLFPFLIISPWWTVRLRMLAMLAFVGFHLGIAMSMSLGLFQYVAIVLWVALLPGGLWNRLGWRPAFAGNRKVIPGALSRVGFVASLFFVVYFLLWNVANIYECSWCKYAMPQPLRVVGRYLNTRQEFRMFDYPPQHSNWFIYDGRLADGSHKDLFRDKPLDSEQPESVVEAMPSIYWRQFHRNLLIRVHAGDLPLYRRIREQAARFVFDSWNARHNGDEQAVSLRVTACFDEIRPPDSDEPVGQIREVWAQIGDHAADQNLFDDVYRQLREKGEILP